MKNDSLDLISPLPAAAAPATATRRRGPGAPPGNKNALKHGFYSRSFREIDLADLDQNEFDGLKDEITMLRVYIRRVTEMSDCITTFDEALCLLRVLSLASISLTRLITTQHLAFGESGNLAGEIDQAMEDLFSNTPLFQSLKP